MQYKLNKEEQEKHPINRPYFATKDELEAWQIEEIKKGIAEADAGDLIDHSVVVDLLEEKT